MDEPSEAVLTWAAARAGVTTFAAVESLHEYPGRDSGTFRLRRTSGEHTTDLVLRVPVPDWIGPPLVVTGARALELAHRHGLAAPRLVACDLDGQATGTVATLETHLPGSSALPPTVSTTRLQQAGAAIAKVHATPLDPSESLPYRPRPIAVDDFAAERRDGRMPTTPLLQLADEQVTAHPVLPTRTVFVHGDVHGGNMLWDGDTHVTLIDWKTAGAGDPGVDIGALRLQMALLYGPGAPDHVLDGWQRQTGAATTDVPYWDAVAALNTPTELHGWPGLAEDGSRLDAAAVIQRRDAFLQSALDQLDT